MPDPSATYRFTREMRLTRPDQFARVRLHGVARYAGPLRIAAVPNELGFNRMGLTISRRFGPAVLRNRLKRRMREALRLLQHDLPVGYDLVIGTKVHDSAPAAQYRLWLADAVRRIDRHYKDQRAA